MSLPVNQSTDDLKSVTESLYKQNLEIAQKNKTLSLLRKLYDITLQSLSPVELADEIVTNIRAEFEYEMVGIFNYGTKRDRLFSLALTESSRLKRVEENKNFLTSNVAIENASKHPFFSKVILGREMGYTENPKDIWESEIADNIVKKIEEEGHVRSSLAYPLISEEKVIGILVIELNRGFDKLTNYEKESFENITNVAAIGLEKAILYEKLQITNKELEEANNRQENLIHFISHEVKGFLTKDLYIFSAVTEGDYGQATPELLTAVQEGITSTKKGVDTVLDILNASNIKKGTTNYAMQKFNLRDAIIEIAEDLKLSAIQRGLSYYVNIKSDVGIDFTGDKEQLKNHVFRNLIDNAIKYTIRGEIDIKLYQHEKKLLFSVKDSGVGITDEDKKRLFTEGGRGKESLLVNVNSTGYGLYIAKSIVVAHKGSIWAESEGKDKGTTFYVELPIT